MTEQANGNAKTKAEEGKQDPTNSAEPTTSVKVNRNIVTPANATASEGSSSTTTGANVQSVAGVSSPDYSNLYSANPLTQGANRGTARGAGNASLTARASSDSTLAQPTNLSTPVKVNFHNVEYSQANVNQYPMLIQRSPYVQQTILSQSILPATNTDNQYLQTENAAVRTAQERQNKYVDKNKFRAIALPQPTAPIPTRIYTRTNLLKQAGEDDNPLSILEGNPFVAPQQQYFVQLNEEFAPRPTLTSFTTDPYIGVHKRSPIAPNSENEQNQKKTLTDCAMEIREHKYFPFAILAIILITVFSLLRRN